MDVPPVGEPSPPTTVTGSAPSVSTGVRPTTPSVYAHITGAALSTKVLGDVAAIYVPNGKSDTVSVIDPATFTIVSTHRAGREPQHVVPSFDLRTLWVLNNSGNSLIPIDPSTGSFGAPVAVTDPYNLYFTPDGSDAIVVAEALLRLDFRDPITMALRSSLETPTCDGINHIDYSGDFRYLIATCEFAGAVVKIDVASRTVVATLPLAGGLNGTMSMPQDVRVAPDGHTFYVADMASGGLHILDGDRFVETGFVATGVGAHSITPGRDGRLFYIGNRGWATLNGRRHGPGSVSVFDTATGKVTATWPIPGGGSPDMGNLDAAGTTLWLSGRYDSEVYAFDVTTGNLVGRVPVGEGPHGLTVWPQPGRFSLGHTGNMR
jgi:YVTN family beta-propeller protein